MTKLIGKEIPWEKQKEMLVEAVALKLPLLYNSLVETYGEEKGRQMYDEIFETNFKKRSKRFEGKSIVNIMMAEIDLFPAFGWDIWIEKKEENGQEVCYEHLGKCPHLEATRKYGLPDPRRCRLRNAPPPPPLPSSDSPRRNDPLRRSSRRSRRSPRC